MLDFNCRKKIGFFKITIVIDHVGCSCTIHQASEDLFTTLVSYEQLNFSLTGRKTSPPTPNLRRGLHAFWETRGTSAQMRSSSEEWMGGSLAPRKPSSCSIQQNSFGILCVGGVGNYCNNNCVRKFSTQIYSPARSLQAPIQRSLPSYEFNPLQTHGNVLLLN